MSNRRPTAIVGFALACAACASGRQEPAAGASQTGSSRPIVVPRTVVTANDAATVPELYERARRRFADSDFAASAREFDRVVSLEPDGALSPAALFYAGFSHDNLGNHAEALARYEQVARRYPQNDLAREALIRSIRLAAYLEQWQRTGDLSDRVIASYRDLGPIEEIVTHSGKALALVAGGDPEAAVYFVEKGRTVVERFRLDAAGTLPRDLAQLYFALGEIRRVRGERVTFNPTPTDFATVLERRCQLLLDAQSAYSDAMRAYDSHWSAMAGYRVGELYETLHRDLMSIPVPPAGRTDARRALFEGAMRLRYSILLEKGAAMMEHTVAMAARTGERSAWVERARESLRTMEQSRARENDALARLPYSREQLEKALDDLAARKNPPTPPVKSP